MAHKLIYKGRGDTEVVLRDVVLRTDADGTVLGVATPDGGLAPVPDHIVAAARLIPRWYEVHETEADEADAGERKAAKKRPAKSADPEPEPADG